MADLILPRGKEKILKAEDKDYDRGLLVKLLDNGGYSMKYWYETTDKAAPVEILVDGKSIKKALNDGVLDENRLSYSVKKILMAKYKAGLHIPSKISVNNLKQDMNSEEDKALFDELTKQSITVIKNDDQILPIRDLSKKIAYLKMGDSDSDEFFKMLNHYTKVDLMNNDSDILSFIKSYDYVIVGLHKSDKTPFESYKFSSVEKNTLMCYTESYYREGG